MKKSLLAIIATMLITTVPTANADGKRHHKKVCVAGIVYHENGNGRVVWEKYKSGKSFRDHVNHGDHYRCKRWKRVRPRYTLSTDLTAM